MDLRAECLIMHLAIVFKKFTIKIRNKMEVGVARESPPPPTPRPQLGSGGHRLHSELVKSDWQDRSHDSALLNAHVDIRQLAVVTM